MIVPYVLCLLFHLSLLGYTEIALKEAKPIEPGEFTTDKVGQWQEELEQKGTEEKRKQVEELARRLDVTATKYREAQTVVSDVDAQKKGFSNQSEAEQLIESFQQATNIYQESLQVHNNPESIEGLKSLFEPPPPAESPAGMPAPGEQTSSKTALPQDRSVLMQKTQESLNHMFALIKNGNASESNTVFQDFKNIFKEAQYTKEGLGTDQMHPEDAIIVVDKSLDDLAHLTLVVDSFIERLGRLGEAPGVQNLISDLNEFKKEVLRPKYDALKGMRLEYVKEKEGDILLDVEIKKTPWQKVRNFFSGFFGERTTATTLDAWIKDKKKGIENVNNITEKLFNQINQLNIEIANIRGKKEPISQELIDEINKTIEEVNIAKKNLGVKEIKEFYLEINRGLSDLREGKWDKAQKDRKNFFEYLYENYKRGSLPKFGDAHIDEAYKLLGINLKPGQDPSVITQQQISDAADRLNEGNYYKNNAESLEATRQAYFLLRDEARRAKYDAFLKDYWELKKRGFDPDNLNNEAQNFLESEGEARKFIPTPETRKRVQEIQNLIGGPTELPQYAMEIDDNFKTLQKNLSNIKKS